MLKRYITWIACMLGLGTALLASTLLLGTSPNKIVLSSSNTVSMFGEFTGESSTKLFLEVQKLDAELPAKQPIYIVIYSPGGEIDSGLELIDNLNSIDRPIHTISIISMSMGFHLAEGLSGTRYLTHSGIYMSHKAHGGFNGEFPGQLDNRYNFYLRRLERLDQLIVGRSNGKLTLQDYRNKYENELWCEGQDCVDQGLADAEAVVSCDKSLRGVKEVTTKTTYLNMPVEVTVQRPACPMSTGTINTKISVAGKKIQAVNVDWLAKELNLTPSNAVALKTLIEMKIEAISPTNFEKH